MNHDYNSYSYENDDILLTQTPQEWIDSLDLLTDCDDSLASTSLGPLPSLSASAALTTDTTHIANANNNNNNNNNNNIDEEIRQPASPPTSRSTTSSRRPTRNSTSTTQKGTPSSAVELLEVTSLPTNTNNNHNNKQQPKVSHLKSSSSTFRFQYLDDSDDPRHADTMQDKNNNNSNDDNNINNDDKATTITTSRRPPRPDKDDHSTRDTTVTNDHKVVSTPKPIKETTTPKATTKNAAQSPSPSPSLSISPSRRAGTPRRTKPRPEHGSMRSSSQTSPSRRSNSNSRATTATTATATDTATTTTATTTTTIYSSSTTNKSNHAAIATSKNNNNNSKDKDTPAVGRQKKLDPPEGVATAIIRTPTPKTTKKERKQRSRSSSNKPTSKSSRFTHTRTKSSSTPPPSSSSSSPSSSSPLIVPPQKYKSSKSSSRKSRSTSKSNQPKTTSRTPTNSTTKDYALTEKSTASPTSRMEGATPSLTPMMNDTGNNNNNNNNDNKIHCNDTTTKRKDPTTVPPLASNNNRGPMDPPTDPGSPIRTFDDVRPRLFSAKSFQPQQQLPELALELEQQPNEKTPEQRNEQQSLLLVVEETKKQKPPVPQEQQPPEQEQHRQTQEQTERKHQQQQQQQKSQGHTVQKPAKQQPPPEQQQQEQPLERTEQENKQSSKKQQPTEQTEKQQPLAQQKQRPERKEQEKPQPPIQELLPQQQGQQQEQQEYKRPKDAEPLNGKMHPNTSTTTKTTKVNAEFETSSSSPIQWLTVKTTTNAPTTPTNAKTPQHLKLLPLHKALYQGASLSDLYKILSKAKLNPSMVEERDPVHGNTPLHIACVVPFHHHQIKQTRKLNRGTADDASAHSSKSRAHPFYDDESLLLVIQLLYNLCPKNIKRANKEGQLPLHLAVMSAASVCSDINRTDPSDKTNSILGLTMAASVATSNDNENTDPTTQVWLDIIGKMIYEYPRALHIPNHRGQLPLDLVIHKMGTCPDIVALIEEEIAFLDDTYSSVGESTLTTLTTLSTFVNHFVLAGAGQQRSSTEMLRMHPQYYGPQQQLQDVMETTLNDATTQTGTGVSAFQKNPPENSARKDAHFADEEIAGKLHQHTNENNNGTFAAEMNTSQKPPPIWFESSDYVEMGDSNQFPSFFKWMQNMFVNLFIRVFHTDCSTLSNSKATLVGTFLLVFTGFLFLPKAPTHHPIRVAFIGNSIIFVNDLPRFMEAISVGYISQDSCLHGATRLRTILNTGNGMYNKWRTGPAFIKEINEDDDLFNYIGENEDDDDYWQADDDTLRPYEGQHVIYDFGACSVQQLLLGTDDNLEAYNDNGYYRNDGKNPCFRDPAYLQYQHQRYLELAREHRLEEKQESNPDSVLHLWDYVVLNDQTLVPAIDEERELSEQVLKYVYEPLLKQINARPVLLMTHAYSYNASVSFNSGYDYIWQDVPTFTSALYRGYQGYFDVLAQVLPQEQAPLLAPAGLAYLVIWEENRHMWERLFFIDGFHPTPHGTFLIGCVLYATLYNRMPSNIPQDVGELWERARKMQIGEGNEMPIPTQSEAIYLAKIAERVVLRKYKPKSLILDLDSSS